MSYIVREIIEWIQKEEYDWESLAEHFELCASCGGIPTGSYHNDSPFIECESDNCDVAFELMCEDFITDVGNGNSTRNLMSQLYDLMKEHKALGDFAKTESDWLKMSEQPYLHMTVEDLVWSRLNSYGRDNLNQSIVEYWKQERGVDA